jgi:hypothetical protein
MRWQTSMANLVLPAPPGEPGHLHRRWLVAPGNGLVEVGLAEQVGHDPEVGPQEIGRAGAGSPNQCGPGLVQGLLRIVDGEHGIPGGSVGQHRIPVGPADLLAVLGQIGRDTRSTGDQSPHR